jgi:hypothetical protein
MLIGNLLAFTAPDFGSLLVLRFLIGCGGDGLAYVSAILVLGCRTDPIRAFAIYGFSNMCFTGVGLALLPQCPGGASWQLLRGLFTLLGSLCLLASRWLPTSNRAQRPWAQLQDRPPQVSSVCLP